MKMNFPITHVERFDLALMTLDNHLALSGKSRSTRKKYVKALHRFILIQNKLPEESSKNEIVNYFMKYQQENKCAYASLRGYVYGLKYYLNHIAERNDLFQKIPIPVIKQYDFSVVNTHEINLLFDVCKNGRELLIVQLLYETGIRVGELVRLKLDDFDFNTKSLTIRNSKNRRTRTVIFGSSLTKTLEAYLANYKSLFSDSLVTRQFHPFIPLSTRGVSWVLDALERRSGIRKRLNPHSLRHAFAVHYLNFGGTIFQLQRLLGHVSLITTYHYLQYASLPESNYVSVLDEVIKLKFKSKIARA